MLPVSTVQSKWAKELPPAVQVDVFSRLDPESLSACEQVCDCWWRVAHDWQVYKVLAARFSYFDRKGGVAFFRGAIRVRFLAIYKQVRGYDVEKIEKSLPPFHAFGEPLDNVPRDHFPDFDYKASRQAIFAYLHLGGAKNETGFVNRPFFLACYFGDKAMIETIRNTKGLDLKSVVLLNGAVFAVIGNQPEIVKQVKQLGANLGTKAIFQLPWSEYLLGYANTEEMREAINS